MATIRDVARLAGVSTATVSHVMNRTRPVAEATRVRVFAAMKELRFQPSAFARGMRRQSLKTVGLVTGDFSDPFYAQIFQGLETVVRQSGYAVMIASSEEDPAQEAEAVHLIVQHGLDGVVIAPAPEDGAVREFVESIGFPVVLIDRQWDNAIYPSVILDNRHASRSLVDHLVREGHRQIVFVAGRQGLTTTVERVEGYIQAMKDHGLEARIIEGGSTVAGGWRAAEWWDQHRRTTQAMICGNNLMLVGLVEGLKHLGGFPQVTVVGIDNERWTALMNPPLTVVEQPAVAMGEEAGRLLIEQIEEGLTGSPVSIFRGQLVGRGRWKGV